MLKRASRCVADGSAMFCTQAVNCMKWVIAQLDDGYPQCTLPNRPSCLAAEPLELVLVETQPAIVEAVQSQRLQAVEPRPCQYLCAAIHGRMPRDGPSARRFWASSLWLMVHQGDTKLRTGG
jgi:hypothetical protein